MTSQRYFSTALWVFAFLSILLTGAVSEATIQRLDICDVHFQPSDAVPVIRGATTTVTVRGDFVNVNTGIEKNSDISISVLSSGGGGGLNTFIALEILPSTSVGTGNHTIKIHYAVELNGPDVFTINVLAPQIDTIKMNPNVSSVAQGTPVTITATGSGLTGVRLNSTFALITDIHYTSTTDSTIQFTGNAHQTFSIRSVNYDRTAMPESCPGNHATGTPVLSVTVSNPPPPPPPPPKGGGGGNPPPQPDLSLVMLNTFRSGTDFSNNENSTYNLCPTGKTNDPKVSTIPALTIRVLNDGTANITTPFTVRVTRNGAQINTFTVNSLNAGATTDLIIPRAENRVCGTLDVHNPAVCHRCGAGVQGIPVWNDLGIQVTADSGNVIAESNENNNVQSIQ